MELKLNGSRTIAADGDRVWARLMDPRALTEGSRAIESVEALGAHHFVVTVAVGLGFFKLRAPLDVQHVDLIDGKTGTMVVAGEAMGTSLRARAGFVLLPEGNGTRLDWTVEGAAEGKLAHLAGNALEATARKLTEQFWDDFAAKVSRSA
ncbi:MAG: CoxG family protein [Gemmatimonadales bacterium]